MTVIDHPNDSIECRYSGGHPLARVEEFLMRGERSSSNVPLFSLLFSLSSHCPFAHCSFPYLLSIARAMEKILSAPAAHLTSSLAISLPLSISSFHFFAAHPPSLLSLSASLIGLSLPASLTQKKFSRTAINFFPRKKIL